MHNPQERLCCIHIGGTNGKGSCSLMIASTLSMADYRVGRFVSPHLHSYFERISIDGQAIPADRFLDYLQQIEDLVPAMIADGYSHPTEFEVLTAVAFKYFADEMVDLAVIEVGMGGIYDSTNVITPLVSVITGVDYDHMQYLGNTLADIAYNKAGIIKEGIPIVTGIMPEEAFKVIRDHAEEMQAPLIKNSSVKVYSHPDKLSLDGQIVDIGSETLTLSKQPFSLLGEFQLSNLATSVAVLEQVKKKGYRFGKEDLSRALKTLVMPARLEILCREPLVIADVAHNPQGARALAHSLRVLLPGQEKILVCGILDDKDMENTLGPLLESSRLCVFTRPDSPRAAHWERLAELMHFLTPEKDFLAIEEIDLAVKRALEELKTGEYLLITGSFYLIGKARRYFLSS